MAEETKLNIYQKLLAITEDAEQIPKRGVNSFSNYNYVLAVDVIGHIRKLLIKHGVHVSISEIGDLKRYRDGKNFHSEVSSIASFINTDDPKDYHKVTYHAVAADTLDKDIYKAKTGGLKYLFSQEFKIITDNFVDVETSDDRSDMDVDITVKAEIEKIDTVDGLTKYYTDNKGKNAGVLENFVKLLAKRKAEIEEVEKKKAEAEKKDPADDSIREPGEEG